MTALDTLILDSLAAIAKAKPGLLAGLTSSPRTDAGVLAAAVAAMTQAPAPVPPPVPVVPAIIGRRALGPLPQGPSGVRWAALPVTTREIIAGDRATLQAAIGVAGTRVMVNRAIQGDVAITAGDVEIVLSLTGKLDRVSIGQGVKRVRITGGVVAGIELPTPADWRSGSPIYSAALFAEDVTVDHVRVMSSGNALTLRGKRISITDCDVQAQDFCVWVGDTGPHDNEDIIIAGCKLASAGPQATVRIHDTRRSVVVDNTLSNPQKHNYRIHGRAEYAFAARNTLLRAGMMLGTEPGDACGSLWFVENTMRHDLPSLLEIVFPSAGRPATIQRLDWSRNVVYSNVWADAWIYPPPPPGWTVEGNVHHPAAA